MGQNILITADDGQGEYLIVALSSWMSWVRIVQIFLCTGGVYYICTLYGAVDFLIVLSKGLYGWGGGGGPEQDD
jgi:hypothetical protein